MYFCYKRRAIQTFSVQPTANPNRAYPVQPTANPNRAFQVQSKSIMTGWLSLFHGTARHIPEHFNTLFSETEQLFNISLHVNSSCLGLWSNIYSY